MPTSNQQEQLSPQEEKARVWAELDAGTAGGEQPRAAAAQPAAETQPASTASEAATQQPAAEAAGTEKVAAEDPYAGVPQFVRDELAGLKTMLGQAMTRLRQTEGHIGGLKGSLQQLSQRSATQAAQAAQAAGGDAPSAQQIREAQGDSTAMAKLIEDYPEFGSAVKRALDEQLASVRQAVARAQEQQAQPAAQQAQGVTPEDLELMRRKLLVESRHPGWEDEVKKPDFSGWLERQPREVQMLARSDDPQDAIRLFDLRRAATAPTQQQQRLEAAAQMPQGRGGVQARAKPVEQMTKAEYWAYLDSLEKQGA